MVEVGWSSEKAPGTWSFAGCGVSCWHGRELVGMVSAGDWSEESSNINPQADAVQSLNEESGSTAISSNKNSRIWEVKAITILFKSDMLFGGADSQNLVESLYKKEVWKHTGFLLHM